MDPTLSDKENLEILQALFGIGPVEARHWLAMAKGQSQGDVVEMTEVVPPNPPHTEPVNGS